MDYPTIGDYADKMNPSQVNLACHILNYYVDCGPVADETSLRYFTRNALLLGIGKALSEGTLAEGAIVNCGAILYGLADE